MSYSVKLLPTAKKELLLLPGNIQKRVVEKLEQLADDPYPKKIKPITGMKGLYRLRMGDYRILYTVKKSRLLVLVIRIGHRGSIYKRLL